MRSFVPYLSYSPSISRPSAVESLGDSVPLIAWPFSSKRAEASAVRRLSVPRYDIREKVVVAIFQIIKTERDGRQNASRCTLAESTSQLPTLPLS